MTSNPSPSNLLTPQNTQDPDTTYLMARVIRTTVLETTATALTKDLDPATTQDLPIMVPDLATLASNPHMLPRVTTSSPHLVMDSLRTLPRVTASSPHLVMDSPRTPPRVTASSPHTLPRVTASIPHLVMDSPHTLPRVTASLRTTLSAMLASIEELSHQSVNDFVS